VVRRTIAIGVTAVLLAACRSTVIVQQSPSAPSVPASPASSPGASPVVSPAQNPPLSEARVEGLYRGAGFNGTALQMTPKCPEGACGVAAKGKGLRVNFTESDGIYRGHIGTNTTCSKGGVSLSLHTSVTFAFRPAAADLIDGVWRATRLLVLSETSRPSAQKKERHGNTIVTLTCPKVHEKSRGQSSLAV